MRYDQLSIHQKQIVNHFEFHHEITTKDLLFKNLMSYAELNKLNVFDYVPMTFIIHVDAQTYSSDFEKFVKCHEIIAKALQSTDKSSPDYFKQSLKQINMKLQQVSLSKERRVVTHCKPKVEDTHFAGKSIWVLKPTDFNRGRGISLFNSIDKLKNLIKYYANGDDLGIKSDTNSKESEIQNMLMAIKSRTFVIQKYIERPLLIHNRKFDIRVWVLVTHEMKVYFFKEGYIRTSSATYTIEEEYIDKVNIHLTNNAVQKYCPKYGAFENGNQLSFTQLQVLVLFIYRNT